jgi:predicted RNA-binding protein YlqC (UPF0109 family)
MHASRQPAPARQCRNRAGNDLQELLLHMAQTLVDVPELVTEGQHTVILEVRMAPTDVGKLIGKQGRIADALRTILSAAAGKQGRRALIEVIEGPPGKRQ